MAVIVSRKIWKEKKTVGPTIPHKRVGKNKMVRELGWRSRLAGGGGQGRFAGLEADYVSHPLTSSPYSTLARTLFSPHPSFFLILLLTSACDTRPFIPSARGAQLLQILSEPEGRFMVLWSLMILRPPLSLFFSFLFKFHVFFIHLIRIILSEKWEPIIGLILISLSFVLFYGRLGQFHFSLIT